MTAVRLITEPRVYVLARPAVDRGELARFLADTGFPGWTTESPCDAQTVVEVAARCCYRSFAKGRPHQEHVAHILDVGHFSVTEHANWTLLITGVSRSLTHELVRHRHCSPSQESQRYVDASDVALVVPPEMLDDHALWLEWAVSGYIGPYPAEANEPCRRFSMWHDAATDAVRAYQGLCESIAAKRLPRKLALKEVRQAARSVLPNCCETRLALTGNARAWREMLAKRLSPAADAEFQRLAAVIRDVLVKEAPDLFRGV